MLNRTEIIGNVGRPPELRHTPSGTPVCDFSVATNVSWTDKQTGERRQRTKWFKITCWNRQAEIMAEYVHKGMLVRVEGEIDASAWVDNDGQARASLELTARDVKFLSSARDRQADAYHQANANSQTARSGGSSRASQSQPVPAGHYDVNDIPF